MRKDIVILLREKWCSDIERNEYDYPDGAKATEQRKPSTIWQENKFHIRLMT